MSLNLNRIIALFLLPSLMLVSAGDALGFSFCVGLDGHVEIESGFRNDFDGMPCDSKHKGSTCLKSGYECCGPCLDFVLQNAAHLVSRHLKTASAPVKTISWNIPSLKPRQGIHLVAGKLVTNPQPRVSQSVLTHRTVVLQV